MDRVRLGIHGVQSIIAVAVIGCAAKVVSSHSTAPYALAIFTAIATFLVAAFVATTSLVFKYAYKSWVFIALNAFTATFWIVTIATLAHHRFHGGCGGYKDHHCYKKRYMKETDPLWAANLALGVLDGALSILLMGLGCWGKNHEI